VVHLCIEEHAICEVVANPELEDGDPCTLDGCDGDGVAQHIRVEDGSFCIGRPGHCVARACTLVCGDGLHDPRAEECDEGMGAPACVDCRRTLFRLPGSSDGVLSPNGELVALRRPDGVFLIDRRDGDETELVRGAPRSRRARVVSASGGTGDSNRSRT
jgi:hypothetical protein